MNWSKFENDITTAMEAVKKVAPLSIEKWNCLTADQNKLPAVYMIKVRGEKEKQEEALEAFRKYRDAEEKLSITRIRKNAKASDVFYVGKKKTDVKSRLKQHFVKGNDKTGALRLYDWADMFDFDIEVYLFPEVSRLLLPSLEDAIARRLEPAVGWPAMNG